MAKVLSRDAWLLHSFLHTPLNDCTQKERLEDCFVEFNYVGFCCRNQLIYRVN